MHWSIRDELDRGRAIGLRVIDSVVTQTIEAGILYSPPTNSFARDTDAFGDRRCRTLAGVRPLMVSLQQQDAREQKRRSRTRLRPSGTASSVYKSAFRVT
jgi:hypothetical protein